MIRQHLRQSWTMMKQHRLFTGIYITGTAVSIALTMVLFIVFYITLGNIYPEYKRDKMLIISEETHRKDNEKYGEIGHFDIDFVEMLKRETKHLEHIAIYDIYKQAGTDYITVDGKQIEIEKNASAVDAGWWQLFDYNFIDGRGFTEKEMHENVAVISETLAMQLFASTKVAGKEIIINGKHHRIAGVVERVTKCTPNTYGDIWISINSPFASKHTYSILNGEKYYAIFAVAKEGKREALRKEIEQLFQRYYQQHGDSKCTYTLKMRDHWHQAFYLDQDESVWDAIKIYFYVIIAILFIPALNLSGMISSRTSGRMVEVGVRRAYGATKRQIVSQVLFENGVLTLMGAVVGLLLSYAIVYIFSYHVTTILDSYISFSKDSGNQLSVEMLFNTTIFLCTLLLTAVLNIASALLPTVLALRKDIVQALYYKR